MATILIIDDDATTLGLLRARLEKAGHKVKEAKDGQEGLRMAEQERPDMVFLDVRMPKVDGWQVCQSIKSNPRLTYCPVIMLTGCSQDAQELYGLQCGADEYITKPWDAASLLKTTTRLLTQAASSRDVRSEVSQQRFRQYVQRMVRLAGRLPKSVQIETMSSQLIRLATQLMASYQNALAVEAEFSSRIKLVAQQADELLYWLGLLHDSKAGNDPEILLLRAEGQVLQLALKDALKTPSPQ